VGSVRLDQVNLVVSDVDASRAFYSRLGLDFGAERDPEWGAHHVSAVPAVGGGEDAHLDVDLDSTAFVTDWDRGWPGGTGVVLGFKVETRDEVDRLVAELTSDGVRVQQPPFDAFWGARYAVVSDPDGHAVGIMSPVDPARRSPHPPPS
jgi:catechol 2,3-dioxygenase-like lactoylglutathione lyase family enzyme